MVGCWFPECRDRARADLCLGRKELLRKTCSSGQLRAPTVGLRKPCRSRRMVACRQRLLSALTREQVATATQPRVDNTEAAADDGPGGWATRCRSSHDEDAASSSDTWLRHGEGGLNGPPQLARWLHGADQPATAQVACRGWPRVRRDQTQSPSRMTLSAKGFVFLGGWTSNARGYCRPGLAWLCSGRRSATRQLLDPSKAYSSSSTAQYQPASTAARSFSTHAATTSSRLPRLIGLLT